MMTRYLRYGFLRGIVPIFNWLKFPCFIYWIFGAANAELPLRPKEKISSSAPPCIEKRIGKPENVPVLDWSVNIVKIGQAPASRSAINICSAAQVSCFKEGQFINAGKLCVATSSSDPGVCCVPDSTPTAALINSC